MTARFSVQFHSFSTEKPQPAEEAPHCNWYALYTRSRHEQVVKKQLDHKKIENYLPVYLRLSQWKDRRKWIEFPIFPNYIFVRIDLKDRLEVLKSVGVVNLVGNGSCPVPVPEDQISGLRQTMEAGQAIMPFPYLESGNRVRICEGPLCGVEGLLVRIKRQRRLVLSVDLIQQSVSVEVDGWRVERIGL